jgi:hypothetical protein
LDGNGFHNRLCEQIVHPVTGRAEHALNGQRPLTGAWLRLLLSPAWLPIRTTRQPLRLGVLSGGAGGGPQTREQWSPCPLSGRHRSIRTLRTTPGPAWRDK